MTTVLSACSGRAGSALIPEAPGVHTRGAATTHSTLATASTLTISGSVAATITGGFTMLVTSGCSSKGYLHVYVSSGTTVSGTMSMRTAAQATGTGSCSTSLTATSVSYGNSSGTTAAIIPLASTAATHASTIAAVWNGGFTLAPSGGYGYLHVFTTSATAYAGGSVKAGMYAVATGTGPVTKFTAGYVSLSSSAPVSATLSGTAVASTPYGFTLSAGTGATAVPIVLNVATIVGGPQLAVGSSVRVIGLGATETSLLAQQIVVAAATPAPGTTPAPTPTPTSIKHVLTEDYLGSPYGTNAVSWPAAAQYLTWAQTSTANANAVAAAGIKTQYYADPNRTVAGVGDGLYTADETTFAHDCNGKRVSDVYAGTTTQYVMQIAGASMQNVFANFIGSQLGHFDSLYEDDAGPLSGFSPYTPFSALPCNYSDASWVAAGQAIDQVSPVPVVVNGLSALNGHDVSLSMSLLDSSNTVGGNYEHCYSDTGTPKMIGWLWQAIENTELQVDAKHKMFVCQLRNTGPADSQTEARLYALASFLLTYDPASSVLWEEFATTSGLRVLPESGLVPLAPAAPTPSSVTGLLANGGTYARQYNQCFLRGTYVGPCAIVVNSDSVSHPFPYPQYTHSLVLSGGGVVDGGTVATNGPAPGQSIGPAQGAIVFP